MFNSDVVLLPGERAKLIAPSLIPVDPAGDHCYRSPTNGSGVVRMAKKKK